MRTIPPQTTQNHGTLYGMIQLDYVADYKYLGLTIDTKLTFSIHLNNTLKSISHKTYQLGKIRNSISAKTALQIYKTMILPILDYGDIFFHNKRGKLLKKLQVLQNSCIRIISKLPRLTNTTEEEVKLGLLPLKMRRSLHILQFAHNIAIIEQDPQTGNILINNAPSGVTTLHKITVVSNSAYLDQPRHSLKSQSAIPCGMQGKNAHHSASLC